MDQAPTDRAGVVAGANVLLSGCDGFLADKINSVANALKFFHIRVIDSYLEHVLGLQDDIYESRATHLEIDDKKTPVRDGARILDAYMGLNQIKESCPDLITIHIAFLHWFWLLLQNPQRFSPALPGESILEPCASLNTPIPS